MSHIELRTIEYVAQQCRMGYHDWVLGACRGCQIEEEVHHNPLNCVYCNTVHSRECYPDRPEYRGSGWAYQPKRPREATARDRLHPEDPRRHLLPEDIQWLEELGYRKVYELRS